MVLGFLFIHLGYVVIVKVTLKPAFRSFFEKIVKHSFSTFSFFLEKRFLNLDDY